MTVAFETLLCVMILGTAGAALFLRDSLAAIVFFIVFGNLLGLAWLSLDAVNVALAEIAIGAGVTGVLLILARARLLTLGDDMVCEPMTLWAKLGAITLCVGFAALLSCVVLSITPDSGLTARIEALMPRIGIENPVTGVLLAFRAYDTLLETFVLLGALVAVWSLASDTAWPHPPVALHNSDSGSRSVAGTFGRVLLPLALVMAAYLVWAGSDLPGGAFQAGTLLAGGLLMATIGGVIGLPRASNPGLRFVLVLGPLVFLAIGLVGAVLGRFLRFPDGMAKMLIVTIEYTLAVSIAATLALLVAGSPATPDKQD